MQVSFFLKINFLFLIRRINISFFVLLIVFLAFTAVFPVDSDVIKAPIQFPIGNCRSYSYNLVFSRVSRNESDKYRSYITEICSSSRKTSNPPLSSLSDYAMNRKQILGPRASGRWGARMDRESKHNFGNIPENEEVGGCNPDYTFAESFFEEDEDGIQWPPKKLLKKTGNLFRHLKDKDGSPYPSYKTLLGEWTIENGTIGVIFDRIQSDPFAPPSNVRIKVQTDINRFPKDVMTPKIRNIAACDIIARRLSVLLKNIDDANIAKGSKKKGFSMTNPSQYVLERKSIILNEECVEARLYVHLPAFGRRIDGSYAARLFTEILPMFVRKSLLFEAYENKSFYDHIYSIEDQQYLRDSLSDLGLIAFLANGSILPRESGSCDMPLSSNDVEPFESPASMKMTVSLPHAGKVTGMGIKKGLTLIVGGGYHGKTTLLQAIQVGIYNKVPGDGREFVVTSPNSVKIRAEDGRSVKGIDISTFIGRLPNGKCGENFNSRDASGSTSQAAAIMEAIEIGAEVLLLDEDISAANFMYRDNLMDSLVSRDKEPITTFLLLVRTFVEKLGISTILVSGSCGLFMDQADTVIQMYEYKCLDKTKEAKDICKKNNIDLSKLIQSVTTKNDIFTTKTINSRIISPESFKRTKYKIKQCGMERIQYGTENIDLSLVEQIVEPGQTCAITNILIFLESEFEECKHNKKELGSLREILEKMYARWNTSKVIGFNGLDEVNGFKPFPAGDCTMPRIFEVAAAINRLRTLSITKFVKTDYKRQNFSK